MRIIAFAFSALLIAFGIGGCAASGRVVSVSDEKISGSRVLALDAPNAPWVMEIQSRLNQRGFKVLRWSSVSRVTEASGSSAETFNRSEAQYVLVISGSAPLEWKRRCFGGGYNFDHISADLVDTESNETLLNINGAGYSEGCAPFSGSIFGDIVDAVESAWK